MLGVLILALTIAIIAAGTKLGLSLGLSILLASLGLGLFSGNLLDSAVSALVSEDSLVLVLSTYTIAVLSELYRVTKAVDELGRGLSSIGRPRVSLALVPAVVGLMPVAGGALLSAPLVEALGGARASRGEVLAYINVWYRHTLIYSYPFSQLLIVLSQLLNVSVLSLVAVTTPVSAAMALIGVPTLIKISGPAGDRGAKNLRELVALVPLLLAIAVLAMLVPVMGNRAIPAGTTLAILLLAFLKGSAKALLASLASPRVGDVVLSVVSVVLLREVIRRSWILADIGSVLSGSGGSWVAFVLVSTLISVAAGSPTTGLFVVIPLLTSLGAGSLRNALLVYAYSFLGYVASPTHLCLLYTVQYFRTSLAKVYKYLLPSTVLALLTATVFYLLL